GWKRDPENAAPGCIFKGDEPGGVAELCHFVDTKTEIHANHCSCRDAECEQPLEDACSLAAVRCSQTLRQIERDHYADQAGTDALQQAAKNQRFIAMRERN